MLQSVIGPVISERLLVSRDVIIIPTSVPTADRPSKGEEKKAGRGFKLQRVFFQALLKSALIPSSY